ncbi:MAG: hypothetical protein EAZ06_01950 [Cytophagales bacterium]|nr:MAG: hypothetical protein EAZ06_01950 [Cytophagales bacterium]
MHEKTKLQNIDDLCKQLVDSFPTDKEYQKKLSNGYYLFASVIENQFKVELYPVLPLNIKILNNTSDFQVIAYDTLGNLIDDAEVKINQKRIYFDKKANTYRTPKSNRKGILTLTYQGVTSYHQIEKSYQISALRKFRQKMNRSFQYIILKPLAWVYHGVNGVIQKIRQNDDYLDEKANRKTRLRESKYAQYSYLVFSKPRYMPRDTVRFKAFVMTNKGEIYAQEVDVFLEQKKITTLQPYRNGHFEGQVILHDTLGLRLDSRVVITIKEKRKKSRMEDDYYQEAILTANYFGYEDYLLNENKYFLSLNNPKNKIDDNLFYEKEPITILAEGKDNNDLNLLDARLRLTVVINTNDIDLISKKTTFVPDTLWKYEQKLEIIGKTKIIIPDSILPPAFFSAEIYAEFLNSNQEKIKKNQRFTYVPNPRKKNLAEFELKKDSLLIYSHLLQPNQKVKLIRYSQNKKFSGNAYFSPKNKYYNRYDDDGDEEEQQWSTSIITLPYTEKINSFVSNYSIEIDSLSTTYSIEKQEAQLAIYTEKTKDSVLIIADNPRNILFWYTIFKGDKIIEQGKNTKLDFKKFDKSSQTYYISFQYVWASQMKEFTYYIRFNDKKIQIFVNQPKKIQPGEKVKIDIELKDSDNQPVVDADVFAYSLTNKFTDITTPILISDYKIRNKKNIKYFRRKNDSRGMKEKTQLLNTEKWVKWKNKMGLNSLEFYKLMYAENGFYDREIELEGNQTNFSPFVVENGELQKIYYIEIDDMPIYFEKADNGIFSFPVNPYIGKIVLRTYNKRITIDYKRFVTNKKLILGVNLSVHNPTVKVEMLPPVWQQKEINAIEKYLMFYHHNNKFDKTYLQQDNHYYWLNNNTRFLFPIMPRQFDIFAKSTDYQDSIRFNIDFRYHFAYHFDTRFDQKIISLTDNKIFYPFDKQLNPQKLSNADLYMNWKKSALNEKQIKHLWNQKKAKNQYDQNRNSSILPFNLPQTILKFITNQKIPENITIEYAILLRENDTTFVEITDFNTFYGILPDTRYDVFLMTEKGDYYTAKTDKIKSFGVNFVIIDVEKIIVKDNKSKKVFELFWNKIYKPHLQNTSKKPAIQTQIPINYLYHNNAVYGKVTDSKGEGIPGVSVLIKGTTQGTVTDLDGIYTLNTPLNSILEISSIGFVSKEVEVNEKMILNIILEEDTRRFSEVVVTGYSEITKESNTGSISRTNFDSILQGSAPGVKIRGIASLGNVTPLYVVDGVITSADEFLLKTADGLDIEKIEVLKDNVAVALYGAKASNGVVVVQTKNNIFASQKKKQRLENETLLITEPQNSLRSNFSDVGFWKPKLVTNQEGKVSFETVFPDDITAWKTIYLAHDNKKRNAMLVSSIQSYKSLVANLSMPRFLVEGDTVNMIGKTANYGDDTLNITTHFSLNKKDLKQFSHRLTNAAIDSLSLIANGKDSLEVVYQAKKNGQLLDGELKKLPIYPYGVKETLGQFMVLEKDTTFKIPAGKNGEELEIYAQTNPLDMILIETQKLRDYEHLCNEQAASKLLALLAEKQIYQLLKKPFLYDKDINKLIKKLEGNQKEDGLWGWWERTQSVSWVSTQVLESLSKASKLGFKVNIRKDIAIKDLIFNLESDNKRLYDIIAMIRLLKNLEAVSIDYPKYIYRWKKNNPKININTTEQLQIWQILAENNLKIPIDSLLQLEQKTIFGNIFWGQSQNNLFDNQVQSTLSAYSILKTLGGQTRKLEQIRNYFFEDRNRWRNTYESSLIIETILEDMLAITANQSTTKPILILEGGIEKKIETFPFKTKIKANQTIKITKKGVFPIYFTSYHQKWNEKPDKIENDFVVNTFFENNPKTLQAGTSVRFNVMVDIKKEAQFLMLEVPIPAGCVYENKNQSFQNHVIHQEYYRDKVCIFIQKLPIGNYKYSIDLQPRYSGHYAFNPTKIEMMYFPLFFGRNKSNRIEIK